MLILGRKDGTLIMGLEDDQYIRPDIRLDDPEQLPEIPGAELDDASEDIGEEDEENNYYSIGARIMKTWKKTTGTITISLLFLTAY